MKISGLDQFNRQLQEAQEALSGLDGDLGTVSFDPTDPASIEAAIQQAEEMIDERVGQYASNPLVGPLIEQMKENYREQILDLAAEKRLENE